MKKVLLLVTLLVLGCTSVCFAFIPESDVAIGGITLSSTEDYVKGIYGQGQYSERHQDEHVNHWIIYDSVKNKSRYYSLEVGINVEGTVSDVDCAEANLATPAGFQVGMNYAAVQQIYGRPNEIQYNRKEGNIIRYAYYSGPYVDDPALSFYVNRSTHKIVHIEIDRLVAKN